MSENISYEDMEISIQTINPRLFHYISYNDITLKSYKRGVIRD